MKILVCIKQVIDSVETLTLDDRQGRLSFPPDAPFRMNRFDEFALEEALLIKEYITGTRVDVLSVGPERANSVLQRALGMGADHALHVLGKFEEYISPFSVASLVAACAQSRAYDLILTGVMSEDAMACQTGQLIAAILGIPCATSVIHEVVHPERIEVIVEREVEGGCRERVVLRMPALLTIQPGIHQPRYPSFSKVMRARTYPQEVIRAEDLAFPENREVRRGVRVPESVLQGMLIEGSPREKARKLIKILHEKSLLTGVGR